MDDSPDGRSLYLGFAELVIILSRDPANGSLRQVAEISPGAVALTASQDGRFVYSRGTGPEVTAFERNPTTGALSPAQTLTLPSGGRDARDGIALGPEQQSLYTTSARYPNASRSSPRGGSPARSCRISGSRSRSIPARQRPSRARPPTSARREPSARGARSPAGPKRCCGSSAPSPAVGSGPPSPGRPPPPSRSGSSR